MKKTDNNPILVGEPKDWYDYDEKGNVISLDVKGNPIINDEKWASSRATANGYQPDGMCIGGSDASVCAGIYPGHEYGCLADTFNSKTALYHKLRGDDKEVSKISDTDEIFRIGHAFEDAVSVIACEEINKELKEKGLCAKLVNDPNMYVCGIKNADGTLKYPHAMADVDRILEIYRLDNHKFVCRYGLEIKTTNIGTTKYPKWIRSKENPYGVPENYEVQVRHYCAVMNLDGFFVAVQEYSMKPSDLVIRFVPRDKELEERILAAEEAFVQRAKDAIPPEEWEEDPIKMLATLGEYKKQLEDKPIETGFDLPPSASELILQILQIDDEVKELKGKIKGLQSAKAMVELNLSTFFEGVGGEWGAIDIPNPSDPTKEVKVFVRQERKRFSETYDFDRLKAEDPELFDRVVSWNIKKTGLSAADRTDLLNYVIEGALKSELETKISGLPKLK